MSEYEDLPEFYVGESGRTAVPTYEARMPCHMVMKSIETGQTGPTLVEEGERFTTDNTPCHQWMPLNRAAGERYDRWLASLPVAGRNLSMEDISEAAHAMRPREGEPVIDHREWWGIVMKYAVTMKERRSGGSVMTSRPAVMHRPGDRPMPVMPFASSGPGAPMEVGRAPEAAPAVHQPQSPEAGALRARKARVAPPMPGTLAGETPQQTAG
jgi:hypothetical protein